jgi:PAS domain S-box-containing protein
VTALLWPHFGPEVVDLSEYGLETIRNDEKFILYNGRRQTDATSSSIFVLTPVLERPAVASLRRMEHEYSLQAELDPDWAVIPIALVPHNGRTMLVLADPGGEPLDRFIGTPLELTQFLRLAIGLSTALGRLHERGLVHKDIKPSNVLVNSASGQVWLTGFGIASRLLRERQPAEPPEFLAGTLPYMAPEQTGRMNRSVDSRSDLYSLGVTLYEMVTGTLPFTASDPMEWVHCHIARKPAPPGEREKNVPPAVSAIIMKLLAKTAEERYQTAAGVESDLRRSLTEWESHRQIDEFPLGAHDTPDRLLIPEKLYGREREIETLLTCFDRVVKSGRPELVLVSGYSGIGKSSVVNELHKVLVPPRGLFASGKFDQYKRDIPYATLAQAFQSLVRLVLTKSEAELGIWRDAFREALGPNGLLIVDLVPELKLIIGEQPLVPVLPPQDAQRRFQLVFRRFISVFARPEHPLALFLDDLQWLDAATLDVLEDLLTQPDVRHLMLIGAYRDNEVDSTHPLIRKLTAIRKAGATVQEIVLASLSCENLEQLFGDSFYCEPERAAPLAELIHEKTAGNPFFAIQFISSLAEESLLTFDYREGRWSWDLNSIRAKAHTDNVVDLMVGKLNRLPVETQRALQLLACIGNHAEFEPLQMISQDPNEETHGRLWEAVRAGLIFRTERSYRFLHDRVQEAAYSLIPEELRAEAHLRIGRLLAAHTPPEKREEKIFEIVNQLNRGAHLITSPRERKRLAELNLIAGRRAKTSTAYGSALSYLGAARALLSEESWDKDYEIIFSLEYQTAECELLSANMMAAEKRLSMLAQRAKNNHDIAVVTRLRLTLYTTLDRSDRGVEVCLDYLRRGGTDWSPHPTSDEVRGEYDRIWSNLGKRQIEDLIELPLMTNSEVLDGLDVLAEVVTPALFCDENLSSLVICRMVNLSLEHGNSDGSCFAYVWFAIILGPRFGNYKDGFRFGQLGYDLVEKRGLKRFQARTYMSFGDIVLPWTKHVRVGRDLVRRAFDAANEMGDVTFAGYCCDHLIKNLLAAGDPLDEVQREAENALQFAQKVRFGLVVDHIKAQLGLIRTLRGLTPKFGSFNDAQFDELRFQRYLAGNPALAELECWYWVRRLQARFFAGDYTSVIDASLKAEQQLWTSPSQFETAEWRFYGALSHAASWDSASPDQRQHHSEALAVHHRQLEIWAENCPENFENRAALVGAEIARIEGRDLDAMRLYEQAIRSALVNGFVHNEAVAYEVAARFYAARGFDTIAHIYLRQARHCYLQWGAAAKVRQLDELHPGLTEDQRAISPVTIGTPIEHLDLGTVIKISQAVSGEMVLDKLIETLMRTAIEHAGASRGLLILLRGDEQRIEAEVTAAGDKVMVRRREAASDALPRSIVNYVIRTEQSIILNDASRQNPFSADPYIAQYHVRSLLCLPLINQGKLIGVLYLENNLAPHVFTQTRTGVLKLLASQAATALENTRLYEDSRRAEETLREQASLLSLTHDAIFVCDINGILKYWNRGAQGLYGWTAEEATGKVTHDLLKTIFSAPHEDIVAEVMRTGRWEGELVQTKKDGKQIVVASRWSLQRDESGSPFGFLETNNDVTESRQAEEERERLRQELAHLAHLNRVSTMGELTASLAHEINQPLAAIVTNAKACLRWLMRDVPNLEEAREAAERIARDGRRASDVISRIRALVRNTGSEKAPLDINQAIQEVVYLTEHEGLRKGVVLRTELAGDLPFVLGDRVQLQQVLLNLIINGVEAMSSVADGPRELLVYSRLYESNQVLVGVQDSGVGIEPENLKKVFDPFYTTKSQGMGMGLAISRSIVENHGGKLWASPNDGPGATFQFTLLKYH